MDEETRAANRDPAGPVEGASRPPRTGWKVVGTIVVVLVTGYLILAGFALTSLNCDGGILGFDQCSAAERLSYIGLSLGGLAGMPLGLRLIWRKRRG